MSKVKVGTLLQPQWTVESVNIDFSKQMSMRGVHPHQRVVSVGLRDKRDTVVYFRGYDYEVAATLCDLGIIQHPENAEDIFSHRMKALPLFKGSSK